MAFEGEMEKTIEGTSLDDCYRKLEQLYHGDAQVLDYTTDWKYGFFHLKKIPYTIAKYIVKHPNAYEKPVSDQEQWEISRQKILESQNNLLVQAEISNKLDQKLDDLTQQITKKLGEIGIAANEKHESTQRIIELLQENEFSYDYIQMIEEKINATFPMDQLDDFDLVQRYVVDWIGETITVQKRKVFRPPHVYVLVGPTGVGKTTTLTKLMAQSILVSKRAGKEKPKGCIITIDNIRAGAFDQLKKLGDAVEYPVLKALTTDDVRMIYEEYNEHVDNIFVDTAGCSPNDSEHLGIMQKILDVKMNPDVYLTVTSSTKASDLRHIFRNYEPFGYDSVIVTKIDESKQIGNVISVLYEKRKSIAYLTNGQHPKNIKPASVTEILNCLTGFKLDKVHIEDKFGAVEFTD